MQTQPKKTPSRLSALLLLAALTMLAACSVDKDYDLDKDIDLTMQLGTNGLQLKLGSTEKIMLNDILELSDQLRTDGTSLYYLVESGSTETTFDINPVTAHIDPMTLHPTGNIFTGTPTGIPVTNALPLTGLPFSASTDFLFAMTGIGSDVRAIREIYPEAGSRAHLYINIEQPATSHVALDGYRGLKITLPSYVRLANPAKGVVSAGGNEYVFTDASGLRSTSVDLGTVEIDRIAVNADNVAGHVDLSGRVSMEGEFDFTCLADGVLYGDDTVGLSLRITVGDAQSNIDIDAILGRVNPEIDPKVDPIDITSDLPDFLSDEAVTIDVSNPTIKFDVDMREIPATLDLTAVLAGYKDGRPATTVYLPQTGKAELKSGKRDVLYFYQGDAPYDPSGQVAAGSNLYRVTNISTLITKLPDEIHVDINNGKVTVRDEEFRLQLGHEYRANVDYDIMIPFIFDRELRIVYNDSVTDMADDLEDLQADSAQVSAEIVSTVPLRLTVSATAFDVHDQPIPSVHISEAAVEASEGGDELATSVVLKIELDDPAALQRVDKLKFTVNGTATDAGGRLTSKQYLTVRDIRLKLLGSVRANLN